MNFDNPHSFRDDFEISERMSERSEASDIQQKLARVQAEFHKLHAIVMEIIGKPPAVQRDVVQHGYSRYANQDDMPTVRDVVRTILDIPDSTESE